MKIKRKGFRSKWACFNCRKSFLRVRFVNESEDVVCPDCKTISTDMGYLFEAPAKREIRKWKIMEILARNNLRFRNTSNIAFIRYMITGNDKCSPREVEKNIAQYFDKKRNHK